MEGKKENAWNDFSNKCFFFLKSLVMEGNKDNDFSEESHFIYLNWPLDHLQRVQLAVCLLFKIMLMGNFAVLKISFNILFKSLTQ